VCEGGDDCRAPVVLTWDRSAGLGQDERADYRWVLLQGWPHKGGGTTAVGRPGYLLMISCSAGGGEEGDYRWVVLVDDPRGGGGGWCDLVFK
jgi:hypothetical protein